MKVAKLLAVGTGRLYPHEIPLVLISFRGGVDHRATVQLKGKLLITPSRIEPATFRPVAQCLIQ